MKKHKFLFVFLLTVFCNLNSKADTQDSITPIKVLPSDTLVKFIKNYGKDSLIKLIDNRIDTAINILQKLHNDYGLPNQTLEMLLVSKHFNWGLDTFKFNKYSNLDTLYQLYENKGGDIKYFQSKIDSLKMAKIDIAPTLLVQMENSAVRICVVLFGDQINITDKYFESLYNKYKTPGKSSDGYVELYWINTQFAKNYPLHAETPLKYKEKVFDTLYKYFNIPMKVHEYNNNSSPLFHDPNNMYMTSAYTVLAYGLYGNDITINKNGLDLMYLLAFTNYDGGWQSSISINNPSDLKTTFYAIWALEEFKEKLKTTIDLK